MSRDWPNDPPDAPSWPICPVCRLRSSYDEDTGMCFFCLTGREMGACAHTDGLFAHKSALKVDGRTVRWSARCRTCDAVVLIDAKTGENASENGAHMLHSDPLDAA